MHMQGAAGEPGGRVVDLVETETEGVAVVERECLRPRLPGRDVDDLAPVDDGERYNPGAAVRVEAPAVEPDRRGRDRPRPADGLERNILRLQPVEFPLEDAA